MQKTLRRLEPHFSKHSAKFGVEDFVFPQFLNYDGSGRIQDYIGDAGPTYGNDAKAVSFEQIRQFRLQNSGFHPPIFILDKHLEPLVYEAGVSFDQNYPGGLMMNPVAPSLPIGHFVFDADYLPKVACFGIGLGHQIEQFIMSFQCQMIILAESSARHFSASLIGVDWPRILKLCSAKNIVLKIIFNQNATALGTAVTNTMRESANSGLAGSRIFLHRNDNTLIESGMRFRDMWHLTISQPGYFADEFRQCLFMHENLKDKPLVVDRSPDKSPKAFAIVVGSGPSLNSSMDIIKTMRANVFLISCGTGLAPLLRENIWPDIHVELETSPDMTVVFDAISDKAAFEKVPFFCAAGMYPGAVDYWRNRYLYPRADSTSTMLLTDIAKQVPFAFARVGNAGAALAAHFGFKNIVLLGLDTGFRSDDEDHASGSIYETEVFQQYTSDLERERQHANKKIEADLARSQRQNALIAVDAIDGGQVHLDPIFVFSLSTLKAMIGAFSDIKFYQVGFGAKIDGARNMTPEAFLADLPVENSEQVLATEILSSLKLAHIPGCGAQLKELLSRVKVLLEKIRKGFVNFNGTEIAFIKQDQKMYELLTLTSEARWSDQAAAGMVRGTLISYAKTVMDRVLILEDHTKRLEALRAGANSLCHLTELIEEHMRDEISKALA
jgi:hypothetical protein